MELKPGARLRSQVCATEVVLVRPPTVEVSLTCGGAALVPLEDEVAAGAMPAVGLDGGNQLGKRYTSERDESMELLVTKAGAGTLADGATPLLVKQAKALPSSD